MNLINGKLIAEKIKDQITKEVFDLSVTNNQRRPALALILVGERPDSTLYVSLKERAAKTVGIDTSLYKLDETSTEEELLTTINFLNSDETIDGILVQLPLPAHLDTDKIIATITPDKDVDGFHPDNIKKLKNDCHSRERSESGIQTINTPTKGLDNRLRGYDNNIISPVFQSILACLEDVKFDLKDKQVAIVAKPGIFTDSLDKLLEHLGARALNLTPEKINEAVIADLIISAVGQPRFIKAEHIKPDAVLIDIGISQDEEGKTCGDVDAESVQDKAGWLTPVPGGIGPLTIAFALKNTLEFYKSKIKS